ncbi:MAG: hypothetical protein IRY84_01460 [Thermobispora bispora]|nr:hypothetical protein [Thermobispora bispora]
MREYHILVAPGDIRTVVADEIQTDAEAGVRRFLRRGKLVASTPITMRFGWIEVREVLSSAR